MSHAAAAAAPSRFLNPTDPALLALACRYLKRWGLRDEPTARAAAERLAAAVYDGRDGASTADRVRLVTLARRWIEAFARNASHGDEEWLWRVPELLSGHPARLLETPVPALLGAANGVARVLPESEPRLMMQQAIVDSFEQVVEVLHGGPEPELLADLTGAAARLVEPGS